MVYDVQVVETRNLRRRTEGSSACNYRNISVANSLGGRCFDAASRGLRVRHAVYIVTQAAVESRQNNEKNVDTFAAEPIANVHGEMFMMVRITPKTSWPFWGVKLRVVKHDPVIARKRHGRRSCRQKLSEKALVRVEGVKCYLWLF